MKVAIFLLLAFAASVSGRCIYDRWRRFVFAKGQAKVKVFSQDVVKDLRVELVSYHWVGAPGFGPYNVTVLASANADDSGFYVIAGSDLVGCFDDNRLYGLQLYAPKIAHFPVQVPGDTYDTINVPREYVLGENQPVKVFEKDIDGVLNMPS